MSLYNYYMPIHYVFLILPVISCFGLVYMGQAFNFLDSFAQGKIRGKSGNSAAMASTVYTV